MKYLFSILALCTLTFPLKAQSFANKADSICYALSVFYEDSNIYCKYDTLIEIANSFNDSSVVFALGYVDVKGIGTPSIDIYLSKALQKFKLISQDTLITTDCVPCEDPRDIVSVSQKNKKGHKQLFVKCSYFYSRHDLAGTIYRSFIYNIQERPLKVLRNYSEELKYRYSDVGKIDNN